MNYRRMSEDQMADFLGLEEERDIRLSEQEETEMANAGRITMGWPEARRRLSQFGYCSDEIAFILATVISPRGNADFREYFEERSEGDNNLFYRVRHIAQVALYTSPDDFNADDRRSIRRNFHSSVYQEWARIGRTLRLSRAPESVEREMLEASAREDRREQVMRLISMVAGTRDQGAAEEAADAIHALYEGGR